MPYKPKEIEKPEHKFETPNDLLIRIRELETRLKERDKIQFNYLAGKKMSGTTNATAGVQSTHPHYLGKIPAMVFITPTGNGVVYISAATDGTNIYLKASNTAIAFNAFCII